MKHSTRIALGYLAISIAWIGASDFLLGRIFPESYVVISLYKGWFYVGGTALLLKFWLAAEESRRDVVEARLQDSAITDPLTKLHNRIALIDHLNVAVARARREHGCFGLLYLDIDDFKAINDTFGHAAGDTLLVELSRRLRSTLRTGEIAARLGGDEFVVLVEECGDVEGLSMRLMSVLREPYSVKGEEIPITVSIGLAEFPAHGGDADALLHAADSAMYGAKRTGRGQFGAAPEKEATPAG
jgi:diguanylate cyclase (GGDEF)-like protein